MRGCQASALGELTTAEGSMEAKLKELVYMVSLSLRKSNRLRLRSSSRSQSRITYLKVSSLPGSECLRPHYESGGRW